MLKYVYEKNNFSHIVLNTDIDGIFFLCKKAKKGVPKKRQNSVV